LDLGDPAARAWLTDHLSKCIGDWGIDIYRTDFNMPPLKFWQGADEPDRQGVVENHYVAGFYAMWDELRRRHPRLVFDDCASGGRRIDLEMVSRSYALSRSDSVGVKTAAPAWDQAQTAGLSLYVPVHATLSTCGMPKYSNQPLGLYQLRSAATGGLGVSQDNFARDFPAELFRKVIAETRQLRPLYNGDFYPLTAINVSEDAWCAWQFDRPDLGKGFAAFFRRPKAAQATFEAALRALDPGTEYEVTFLDGGRKQKLAGAELARLKVEIPAAPGSAVVTYRRLDR
jgi:alpha-galactosidase